jgi:hypothetical protein
MPAALAIAHSIQPVSFTSALVVKTLTRMIIASSGVLHDIPPCIQERTLPNRLL